MGLQTRGKIFKTFDAQQITERFRKRELVVELAENPRYPQFVIFQLTGNRCEILDDFEVGDEVDIEFSLRGREWTSPQGDVKYFNSLDVWKLDRVSSGGGHRATGGGGGPGPGGDEPPPHSDADAPLKDDVPF